MITDRKNGRGRSGKLNNHLKGGIIGFGNVACYAHVPAWEKFEEFSITAVADASEERRKIARNKLPHAAIYSDYREMLEEEKLDFVDICTPPCYHAEMIEAACLSGVHVFCEKPLATGSDDLERLRDVVARSENIVFTVNNWKHAPIFKKTREMIRSGKIGKVREVKMFVLRPSNSGGGCYDWRKDPKIAGGGILIDHGWHNLYLVLSLVGEDPHSMRARIDFPGGDSRKADDNVKLTIKFPQSEAKVYMTWRAHKRRNLAAVKGETGTIFIKDDHITLKRRGDMSVCCRFDEALSAGSHHKDWMEPVIGEFRVALEDSDQWKDNFAEAQWCARLIQLAYTSRNHTGKYIEIPQDILRC